MKWTEIGFYLENHYSLFYAFWTLSSPVFDDPRVKTAAVGLDDSGRVTFYLNQKFWEGLSDSEQIFVLAHECLHLVLHHPLRMEINHLLESNWAADLVVNHQLVDLFGFPADSLRPRMRKSTIWVDTVFKGRTDVATDLSMEEYLDLLLKSNPKNSGNKGEGEGGGKDLSTLDEHRQISEQQLDKVLDKVTENLREALSSQELNDLKNTLKKAAGLGRGIDTLKVEDFLQGLVPLNRKRSWQSLLIKKRSFLSTGPAESWVRENPKLHAMGETLRLPFEASNQFEKKPRVWFFLDLSGSCVKDSALFASTVLSVPPGLFKQQVFGFDTQVKEVVKKNNQYLVWQGGGTSFNIIEKHILKSGVEYPDAVFILTDGEGTNVSPRYPERWYWFLTNNRKFSRRFIHEKSTALQLDDFVQLK